MRRVRPAIVIWFSLGMSVPVLAQEQHAEPKILEINGSSGGVTSWRRVETRTTNGAADVVTTAEQTPGIEGWWETRRETTTETIRGASGEAHVTQNVYTYDAQRRRVLLERTESDQARSPGSLQTTSRTWTADINGGQSVTSQSIEEHRSGAGASETGTRLFTPDVNGGLAESTRTTHSDRPISGGVIRHDSSVMRRDLNGAWQPIETRQADVRDDNSAQHVDEEFVSRPDINGVIGISERTVTGRSQDNGREDVLIERYVPRDPGAANRSPSRMDLSERTRVSTTTRADGTRETVEEVEGRNPVAAGDPMRLRRRVVTTIRPLGGDRSVVERQTFDLDANGRLVLTATERHEGSAP